MRRALLLAIVLLVGSALGDGTAGARVVDFEQAVPAMPLRATAAGARWRTTPALRAPRSFDLLGVRWRGGPARVELRVERPDDRWSRWVEAPPAEEPPARATGATQATDPVWTGAAVGYQLRSTRPLGAGRVRFVASSERVSPAAVRVASGGPAVVPRSRWDPHGDCRPRVVPSYGRVDFALVHHTVSLNGYRPRDVPAMVLGICRYHRDGNGWNDIGYNLLVDRYGTVYEGRAGGIDEPVIGAQAQGWNGVSTGVAAIGTYSGAGLPSRALHALARVLAWKLGLAGVPAVGGVGEVSVGGNLNRFAARADVRFQRVSGHRDGGLTECPGSALYAQLPALRRLVAGLMPPPRDLLTISPVAAPQPQGGPIFLTGRLARADGRRPAGVPVALQQQAAGAWIDIGSATTGADGIWSAALALGSNAEIRAVEAGGLASPVVSIPVQAGIAVRIAPRRAHVGARVQVTGTTTPAKARVRVLVERQLAGRSRFRRLRIAALATADGRFALSLRPPSPGTYRVTVTTRADATNAAGRTRALLRVRRG